jgi:hypothetical protein
MAAGLLRSKPLLQFKQGLGIIFVPADILPVVVVVAKGIAGYLYFQTSMVADSEAA